MKREGLLLLALMVCFLYSGVTAQETDLKVYCHGFTGEGACILLYAPHCGSDNKTYTNKCFFCNAYVKSGKTLRLKHRGECR